MTGDDVTISRFTTVFWLVQLTSLQDPLPIQVVRVNGWQEALAWLSRQVRQAKEEGRKGRSLVVREREVFCKHLPAPSHPTHPAPSPWLDPLCAVGEGNRYTSLCPTPVKLALLADVAGARIIRHRYTGEWVSYVSE